MVRTQITEEFGVDYPIISAGMGNEIATGELAGTVTDAGGIGAIGATGLSQRELETEIKRAKELADGPVLVDVLIPPRAPDQRDDVDPPDPLPKPIQTLHRALEEQGIAAPDYREESVNLHAQDEGRKQIEVALDNDVDGIVFGLYTPEWAVDQVHDAGTPTFSVIGQTRHAISAVGNGTDYIIAQGTEGGGHSGFVSTLTLVPQVNAAVDVPVIAAGGIVMGTQILAALALGAEGVWMGTRFVVTRESGADDDHKRAIIDTERDIDTVHTEAYDGLPLRGLRNQLTEAWEGHEDEIYDYPVQRLLIWPIDEAAKEAGLDELRVYPAGQGSAAITDNAIPSAADVFKSLTLELETAYDNLASVFGEEAG